ncbi:MAG: class I SAM-dependent methyltransferase [Anaerolineae bacterium]
MSSPDGREPCAGNSGARSGARRSRPAWDVFAWIEEHCAPEPCDTVELIYDDMESQSNRCLPVVYQPFDGRERAHWRDRGAIADFAATVRADGARLLDFGPGDGWPSLLLAPRAAEVVGVDASVRRVTVCSENARRLGLPNAKFVHVLSGQPLPFRDSSFDCVTAASSVEQTPDPRATLRELARVLRPGGRARLHYESLGRYAGENQRGLWLQSLSESACRLLVYDRDVDGETVRQLALTYRLPRAQVAAELREDRGIGQGPHVDADPSPADLTPDDLARLAPACSGARVCVTTHPSGATLQGWLIDAGFSEVRPTESGAEAAGRLYDALDESERPLDLDGVDALVRPVAELACERPVPINLDPMLTAAR